MREEDKLVRRMAAGDEDAAEALVARYYAEILRYCRWHAPTVALAEDATQETFLRFIRYAGRYEGRGKLRALLYQVARHTCIDMARRRWLDDVPLENAPEPICEDANFAEAQSRAALRELVRTLPEAQREIVLLRFAQGSDAAGDRRDHGAAAAHGAVALARGTEKFANDL